MRIRVLGEAGVRRLDAAAREILARTGVVLPHEGALRLFDEAGARVDPVGQRVRIPSELIDECLAAAGKTFTLYGRDRDRTAAFGVGKRNYNPSGGQAHWVEPDGTRRPPRLDDVVTAARLADVLPRFNIVGAMADPQELPGSHRCVEVAAALLRTTTKPIAFWFSDGASARFVVELFAAVAGSAGDLAACPPAYPFLEPISPLRFPRDAVDVLLETAKVPLPVPVGPMVQAGMSGPATLAGALAQETAEVLAGICLVQRIRPGTPVCFGGIPHIFDMRTTQVVFGGPEQGLMAVAMAEMGAHYGLPVYINVGMTDAKQVDAQAGLEVGTALLMGALAGADIFGHFGIAGADQGGSLAMLVFQHEAIEYVERVLRGFQVNGDTLALDVIDAVGPGGSFVAEKHTAKHFRNETWFPTMLDRSYWPAWEAEGRPDIARKARQRVQELLATYEAHPLDDSVERDVQRVLADARRHLTR